MNGMIPDRGLRLVILLRPSKPGLPSTLVGTLLGVSLGLSDSVGSIFYCKLVPNCSFDVRPNQTFLVRSCLSLFCLPGHLWLATPSVFSSSVKLAMEFRFICFQKKKEKKNRPFVGTWSLRMSELRASWKIFGRNCNRCGLKIKEIFGKLQAVS